MPLRSGSIRSRRTASTCFAPSASRPACAVSAVVTLYPSAASSASRASLMISSSSMTRIEAFVCVILISSGSPTPRLAPSFRSRVAVRATRSRLTRLFGRDFRRRVVAQRKYEAEPRALSVIAFARECSAVLLHDAVRHGQAQARTPALGLRRKERVVDPREMFGRNADAGVRNLDDHFLAADAADHREPSAFLHRVARVEEQVQEHLLELVLHAPHNHRGVRKFAAHLDTAGPELVLEQR